MEKSHLKQIERWFKQQNKEMKNGFEEAERKSQNRDIAILNACVHLRKDTDSLKRDMKIVKKGLESLREELDERDKEHSARVTVLELAYQELERRINQ